jgi:hypothetical protein
VLFLVGPVDLVHGWKPTAVVRKTAEVGDVGAMVVEGEVPFEPPDGFVLVRVHNLWAVVPPEAVEPL